MLNAKDEALLRSAQDKKLNIYFSNKDLKGCGFYRMLLPASVLKDNNLANVEVDPNWNPKLVQWADVIVAQRLCEPEYYEAIEEARAMGKMVVYELDDLLFGVDPSNPSYPLWNTQYPRSARAFRLIGMCDAVTTTTARLANELFPFNKNIRVIPNYLDSKLWDTPKGWTPQDWDAYYFKKNDDYIRIGYTAGASHKRDLELIADILYQISKKRKNVKIIVLGLDAKDILAKIPLASGICRHCMEEGQLSVVEGIDILDYPARLMSMAFDIGIAPLVENSFNSCKSDLKFLEYCALGIPTVASNMKPYSLSIKQGETGFLATSGKDWFNYLDLLASNKELREKMGKEAFLHYEKNTIDKHINEWLEFYSSLVNRHYRW